VEADHLPTGTIIVREPPTAATGVALDARVSAAEQQDDALPQLQRLREDAATRGALVVAEVVSKRASGLNDERPKPTKVLTTPTVGLIVVEHRDRLPPLATAPSPPSRRTKAGGERPSA
jgi:putative resolvase